MAVLRFPVLLLKSALSPVAVFRSPVVFATGAKAPLTVLKSPSALLLRANDSSSRNAVGLFIRSHKHVAAAMHEVTPVLLLRCCP